MENMQIKNKDLAIFLFFKLNKIGNEFSKNELATLKELTLNQLDIQGMVKDVDIEILDHTENLESITFKNFSITDEIIDKLKKIKSLKTVTFEKCIISNFDRIGELDLDYLCITNNRFIRTDFLKGKSYLGLVLTDSDLLDINNIQHMTSLSFLNVSNSHIENPNLIGNLQGLSIVHIENSDIKDISFLESLPNLRTVGIDKEKYDNNLDTIVKLKEKEVDLLEQGYIEISSDSKRLQ